MDPEELGDAFVRKAWSHAAAGRYKEALSLYDEAASVDPENYEAWEGKATVLRAMGRLREALECIQRALELWPSPLAESLRDRLVDELKGSGVRE